MAVLDPKTKEMIGLAAAVAGNCIPCLRYHWVEALKEGCTAQELREAIGIAKMVKQAPIEEIDNTVSELLQDVRRGKDKNDEEGS